MVNNNQIVISPATTFHIPSVVALYQDWEQEGITIGLCADTVDELTAKLQGWFLVACKLDVVIGFVTGETRVLKPGEWAVFPDGGSYLYIEDLYVTPEFRSQGVGSALARKLMASAKAEHIEFASVYSSSQPSSRIIRFYESLGLSVWFVQMFGAITTTKYA